MKVREHRQELNKFMKEVRARDPARRMVSTMTMKMKIMMLIIMITCQVLRYDKLYMGHDVFFYNDKSGRVERLHSAMDSSQSYTRWMPAQYCYNTHPCSLVESVFTADAQQAHDSNWMRRPRSKYSVSRSRPITPLQVQSGIFTSLLVFDCEIIWVRAQRKISFDM